MNGSRHGTGIGQGAPEPALTLAHLPIAVVMTAVLAGLYAAAFRLGLAAPLISLALLAVLVGASALATRQRRLSTIAGTRLILAALMLVCLLAGVAAASPDSFPELMQWSLAAMIAAAGAIIAVENWITEKIGATGPFSRRLARETGGLLYLAAALLLWHSGKVGAWIIVAGAAHYLILVASLVWPALRGGAPDARQTLIGFAAVVALAIALVPWATPLQATALGVIALMLVVARTAVEVRTACTKLP